MKRFGIVAIYLVAFALAGMSIAAALDVTSAPRPAIATQDIYKARIAGNGNAVKGTAGTSAQRFSEGTYAVRFAVDVSDCIYSATLSHKKSLQTPVDGGTVTVTPRYSNVKEVLVQTFKAGNTKEDHGFDILAFCNAPEPAAPEA